MKYKKGKTNDRAMMAFWPDSMGGFRADFAAAVKSLPECFLPIRVREKDGMALADIQDLYPLLDWPGEIKNTDEVIQAAQMARQRGWCVPMVPEMAYVTADGRAQIVALPYRDTAPGTIEDLKEGLLPPDDFDNFQADEHQDNVLSSGLEMDFFGRAVQAQKKKPVRRGVPRPVNSAATNPNNGFFAGAAWGSDPAAVQEMINATSPARPAADPFINDPFFGGAVQSVDPVAADPFFSGAVQSVDPVAADPFFSGAVQSVDPVAADPFFSGAVQPADPVAADPFFSGAAQQPVAPAVDPFFSGAVQPADPVAADPFFSGAAQQPVAPAADPFFSGAAQQPVAPAADPFFSGAAPQSVAPAADPFFSGAVQPADPVAADPFFNGAVQQPVAPAADPFFSGAVQSADPVAADPFFSGAVQPAAPAADPFFSSAAQPAAPAADPFFSGAAQPAAPAADPFFSGAAQPAAPAADPFFSGAVQPAAPAADPFFSGAVQPVAPAVDPFFAGAQPAEPVAEPEAEPVVEPAVSETASADPAMNDFFSGWMPPVEEAPVMVTEPEVVIEEAPVPAEESGVEPKEEAAIEETLEAEPAKESAQDDFFSAWMPPVEEAPVAEAEPEAIVEEVPVLEEASAEPETEEVPVVEPAAGPTLDDFFSGLMPVIEEAPVEQTEPEAIIEETSVQEENPGVEPEAEIETIPEEAPVAAPEKTVAELTLDDFFSGLTLPIQEIPLEEAEPEVIIEEDFIPEAESNAAPEAEPATEPVEEAPTADNSEEAVEDPFAAIFGEMGIFGEETPAVEVSEVTEPAEEAVPESEPVSTPEITPEPEAESATEPVEEAPTADNSEEAVEDPFAAIFGEMGIFGEETPAAEVPEETEPAEEAAPESEPISTPEITPEPEAEPATEPVEEAPAADNSEEAVEDPFAAIFGEMGIFGEETPAAEVPEAMEPAEEAVPESEPISTPEITPEPEAEPATEPVEEAPAADNSEEAVEDPFAAIFGEMGIFGEETPAAEVPEAMEPAEEAVPESAPVSVPEITPEPEAEPVEEVPAANSEEIEDDPFAAMFGDMGIFGEAAPAAEVPEAMEPAEEAVPESEPVSVPEITPEPAEEIKEETSPENAPEPMNSSDLGFGEDDLFASLFEGWAMPGEPDTAGAANNAAEQQNNPEPEMQPTVPIYEADLNDDWQDPLQEPEKKTDADMNDDEWGDINADNSSADDFGDDDWKDEWKEESVSEKTASEEDNINSDLKQNSGFGLENEDDDIFGVEKKTPKKEKRRGKRDAEPEEFDDAPIKKRGHAGRKNEEEPETKEKKRGILGIFGKKEKNNEKSNAGLASDDPLREFFDEEEGKPSVVSDEGFLYLSRKKGGSRDAIKIPRKDAVIVGRSPKEAKIVLKNKDVSEKHAEFVFDHGSYHLTDLDSHNGTFVNGEKLHPNKSVEIFPMDEIVFSSVKFYAVFKGDN